jgi:hypothetical protein
VDSQRNQCINNRVLELMELGQHNPTAILVVEAHPTPALHRSDVSVGVGQSPAFEKNIVECANPYGAKHYVGDSRLPKGAVDRHTENALRHILGNTIQINTKILRGSIDLAIDARWIRSVHRIITRVFVQIRAAGQACRIAGDVAPMAGL